MASTELAPRRSALVERVAAARASSRPVIEGRVVQAPSAADPKVPERAGFVTGVPRGGMTEYTSALGTSTQTDRRSLMQELYEAYLACPWSWASVNAISRTITAGGLVMDWDRDDGEGDQEQPDKPPEVLALERLIAFCNPQQDIRQVLRNVIACLQVFGDAYLEITWTGKIPVAIYNLDCPTTTPVTDEHGQVSEYVQVTDQGQRATFETREVIHITLDDLRSGVFGTSPTQGALLPITGWLFAASCGKEMFRKGLPINLHIDFPAGTSDADIRRWSAQYMASNVGPRNIGKPITTKNGGKVVELQFGKVSDVLAFKDQCRDEIVAEYGCPPAKAGIIESGNLGGGTGEDQNRTFIINTCDPIAELVLEKLNFHLTKHGFGITGWHLKFREIDYRDSVVIEGIRDTRLRNGGWTLNRMRAEIGEPPVEGGDDAVLVDRQNLVLWSDMKAMSTAMVASKGTAPAIGAPPPAAAPPGEEPDDKDDDPKGGPPKPGENWAGRYGDYRKRLAEALRVLPGGDRAA